MYGNVVEVDVDLSVDPERKGLHEVVLPRVRQLPGVQAGFWFEPVDGRGLSITIFESEEAAKGAIVKMGLAPGTSPAPGVTVRVAQTRQVIAKL
jgi:hypothetical protein